MALSIQLGITLIFLLILNTYFASKKKYDLVFSVFIVLLTFVSKEENGIISGVPYDTGGIINLSVAGYDILIILLLSLVFRHGKIKPLGTFWKNAVICTSLTIIIRFAIDGLGVLSNKAFDNYLLPMACALLMIRYLNVDKAITVEQTLYNCILINALVGCCEYFLGKSLLFHNYYMNSVNWYPNTYLVQRYGIPFRCTAFLGHPLTNGMYYLMGVVHLFNSGKKGNPIKIAQFAVLCFAIFATNSRGALLVLSIYILFYLISNKKSLKLCLLAGIGVIIATKLNYQEIYNNLFVRDTGGSSMMVRVSALLNFFNIPIQNIILGMGFNNAGTIFAKYTGGANAEISYIILLLENGIIGFILWFTALLSIYNKKMHRNYNGVRYGGLVRGMLFCFLIYAATSNSFADPGTLTYLLCYILALSRIGKVDTFKENTTYGNGMESKEADSRLPI